MFDFQTFPAGRRLETVAVPRRSRLAWLSGDAAQAEDANAHDEG